MKNEEKYIKKSDEQLHNMENENILNEDEKKVDEKINTNLKRNKEINKALKKVLKELNKDK